MSTAAQLAPPGRGTPLVLLACRSLASLDPATPPPPAPQLEGEGEDLYRIAAEEFPPTTALTSVPCGRCPVIDQCRDGGPISPQTCVYFQQWLKP